MDEPAEASPPRSTRGSCAHHPDRPGHALCMSCRKVVCQECATEWDGINYCAACLAARRRTMGRDSSVLGFVLVTAVSVVLVLLTARLMVWAGVLAMELR